MLSPLQPQDASQMVCSKYEMDLTVLPETVPHDTLLIHGNLGSNNWWGPSIDSWRRSALPGYKGRLILGEWRGCGSATAPGSTADLHPAKLAQDYIQALNKINIEKVHVVGHSTGGLIALFALLQEPQLFARAVLLDPVGAKGIKIQQNDFERFEKMRQDRELLRSVLNSTIYENDSSSSYFKTLVDDAFATSEKNWIGVLQNLANINITEVMSQIQHNVLVMHGEFDQVLPEADSYSLAQTLTNGTFRRLTNQGHSANVENPDLFVLLSNGFLFSDHKVNSTDKFTDKFTEKEY